MGSFTAPKTFNTDLPTMDVEETSSTAETATQDWMVHLYIISQDFYNNTEFQGNSFLETFENLRY